MKITIKHRWNGSTLHECEAQGIREAVAFARKAGANLSGANLRGADLSGANLRGADLSHAALSGANLSGANLRGADLSDADLSGANLSDADLSHADLRGADLSHADLSGAVLTPIRDDIWAVLCSAPAEVPALRQAIIEGKIDGSVYSGACACLVGTLAKARGCSEYEIPSLSPNGSRPAERFFMGISPGHTPENHEPSRLVLAWVDLWLANMRAAFGAPEAP